MLAFYNGDGLRVKKQDLWTPWHHFTWGLGGVLVDSSDGGNGVNNTIVYTPGVSQNVNGTDSFFDVDWLGSTRYLTDSTGNNAPAQERYDAFGEVSYTNPSNWDPSNFQWGNGWGYQAEWSASYEPGIGLEYLRNRYYDPAVGRFISADPLGYLGGLNLLSYAANDPANEVDPDGLNPLLPVLAGGAQGVAAAAGAVEAGGAAVAAGAVVAAGATGHAIATVARNAVIGYVQASFDIANASAALLRSLGLPARGGPPLSALPAPGGTSGNLSDLLSLYARTAASQVTSATGLTSGARYGTLVHTQFETLLEALGEYTEGTSNLSFEVSYKGRFVVARGTPGSVRLDVVVGDPYNPTAAYDLKTGTAHLTPQRIAQIRANLPSGSQNVPIEEVR